MTGKVLKPGARLKSAVSDVQIMVLRAPPGVLDLRCGGNPMSGLTEMIAAPGAPSTDIDGETLTGKRYVNASESLEFLCTKGGAGILSVDGVALAVKQAKALPSSD
jgi:hypothetical protein